jgi:hypothetical protein
VAADTADSSIHQPNGWRKGGHRPKRTFFAEERDSVVYADRMIGLVTAIAGPCQRPEARCRVLVGTRDVPRQDAVVAAEAGERIGVGKSYNREAPLLAPVRILFS